MSIGDEEWVKKLWYVYTMEYYSAIKRNEFEPVVVQGMNLELVIQSEVSQKERNKYSILKHIYVESREKAMAPHSSTLAWKIPLDGGAWWAAVHGVAKSRTQLSNFTLTFHFHALEKEMATHSSVLAWRIPGMEKPGRLQSMGSHRVGHN